MSYEYQILGHSINTMGKENLQGWLNALGVVGWRLVFFHPDEDTPVIFERKIEANQKLRDIQLGKESADNDGKKTENKGD
jgi:hypothetical protein